VACSARYALVLSILVVAPSLSAQPAPRRPGGIYAGVNVEELIKREQAVNPSVTSEELQAYVVRLYQDLLGNPAVSGLALWENWDALNPNPPTAANPYAWSYVDAAFEQISAWNSRSSSRSRRRERCETEFPHSRPASPAQDSAVVSQAPSGSEAAFKDAVDVIVRREDLDRAILRYDRRCPSELTTANALDGRFPICGRRHEKLELRGTRQCG
jgi:hypothetical protein